MGILDNLRATRVAHPHLSKMQDSNYAENICNKVSKINYSLEYQGARGLIDPWQSFCLFTRTQPESRVLAVKVPSNVRSTGARSDL